jgi:DNA-binding NarL/FixJ family response regulator
MMLGLQGSAAPESNRAVGDARRLPAGALAGRAPPAVLAMESIGLTPRQSEVLSLLLKGLPNKLIARELNLSVETVKDHVAAVLRALGVSSRTQAVLAVSQMTQMAIAAAAEAMAVLPAGRTSRAHQHEPDRTRRRGGCTPLAA